MTTTMTDTYPDLAFSSDPASGTLHGAPTMPFSALAWSSTEPEEAVVHAEPAPVVAAAKPRISRVVIAGTLFGGVTVVAAFGAIMLGGNDSPATPLAVVDHTKSAPYVPPAPLPTVNRLAVPAPAPVVVSAVTVPAVAPPKVAAPTQPVAAPPVTETPKPTQQRPRWYWLRRILQQHHEQDGQDQKR